MMKKENKVEKEEIELLEQFLNKKIDIVKINNDLNYISEIINLIDFSRLYITLPIDIIK